MLWHWILRHIGEKGLQALQGKCMVEGMSNCRLDLNFCEHCLYGKNNEMNFPYSSRREKDILELIHNVVFGPLLVPSLRGFVYCVSFIDDFSRNTWLYLLKRKSDVFSKFKEFKALVENQIGRKISGEFCVK